MARGHLGLFWRWPGCVGKALGGARLATAAAFALTILAGASMAQQPLTAAPQTSLPKASSAANAPAGGLEQRRPTAPPIQRCDPARTLGVSRILEVDTSSGPRFGHVQYRDHTVLQDGEVILTFDDGPVRANTQGVLDALEAQCAKATFFMVGAQALADPDMVKRIQARGHTIANHTWSHADLRRMPPQMARREIELGFAAVSLAAGQPIAPFFRFPYLSDTTAMKQMAATRGFGVFSIDIDSLDYRNKRNPDAIHAEVMRHLTHQRKGILLFHDIHRATAEAMPRLLAELKRKNFRIVHMRPARSIETIAEFDAVARKEFGAKRTAAATNKLAPRGVTFAMPSPASTPGAIPRGAIPQGAIQGVVTAPAPPPPPKATRPALPPGEEDWRRSIFN